MCKYFVLAVLVLIFSCNNSIKDWSSTNLREIDLGFKYPNDFKLIDQDTLPLSEQTIISNEIVFIYKGSENKELRVSYAYLNSYKNKYNHQNGLRRAKRMHSLEKVLVLKESRLEINDNQFAKLEMKVSDNEDQPYYVLELLGRFELGPIRTNFFEDKYEFKCPVGEIMGFDTRITYRAPYDENWKEHQKEVHKIISHLEFDNR